jgi:hypothetical protein
MYTFFDDLQGGILRLWSWRPARRRAPVTRPMARPTAAGMGSQPLGHSAAGVEAGD